MPKQKDYPSVRIRSRKEKNNLESLEVVVHEKTKYCIKQLSILSQHPNTIPGNLPEAKEFSIKLLLAPRAIIQYKSVCLASS